MVVVVLQTIPRPGKVEAGIQTQELIRICHECMILANRL